MLIGKLDLSLTSFFNWETLEELENNSVPCIQTKRIYIEDREYELLIVSNGSNVHVYRIDEPWKIKAQINFKKLGVISAPMNIGRLKEESFTELIFDQVDDKKFNHIVVAWANYIACYKIILEAIIPENFIEG
jgi:hypothetical protein